MATMIAIDAARSWADRRATADLRMGVLAMMTREEHDRELDEWRDAYARAREAMGDVWCHHCAEPAVAEVRLTSGETRAYCGTHITRLTIQTPLERMVRS